MRRRHAGFTLIELLVVVAVLGVLASLAVPLLLRAVGAVKRSRKASSLAQAPLVAKALPGSDGVAALAPAIIASDVTVRLEVWDEIEGVRARAGYDAHFDGTFRLRNQSPEGGQAELSFAFPPGVTEARDVRFEARRQADDAFREPEQGIRFQKRGIRWTTHLDPGAELWVHVTYVARGRGGFRYAISSGGRVETLAFRLLLPSRIGWAVGQAALRPTAVDDASRPGTRTLTWNIQNLVTDRAIAVELTGGRSPLGQLVLLARLFGLCILAFGAGFWYLAEGYRPGALRTFRWPHFLLLGGTFFVFFPVYAATALELGQAAGIALGLGASLPLVTLHIARFLDRRFALTRALPLAAASIGLVLGLTLAPGARVALGVGAAVVALGLVTWTFPRWSAHRKETDLCRERDARRQVVQAKLDADVQSAVVRRGLLDEAAAGIEAVVQRLADGPTGEAASELAAFEARRQTAEADRSEVDTRAEALARTRDHARFETEAARLSIVLSRHRERIDAATRAGHATLASLEALWRSEVEERAKPPKPEVRPADETGATKGFCGHCGEGVAPGHRHCPACGARRPRRVACNACGHRIALPETVLRPHWRRHVPRFCQRCGAKRERAGEPTDSRRSTPVA